MLCPTCHYPQPDPVPVCPACERPCVADAENPPLVGRARMLALLDARLDEVLRTGGVHRVGLAGAVGSGRSRLMNTFARRRANTFSTVRTLRSFRADALDHPAERLLFLACGLDARWPLQQQVRVARERLAGWVESEAARVLETLLFRPAPWAVCAPDRIEAALALFLDAHLAQSPLVLLLETPGAAPEILRWLEGRKRPGEGAILVLCEVPLKSSGDPLGNIAVDETLTLEPLDRAQISDLLGDLSDRGPAPDAIADAVLEASRGHPAAVREAAAALFAAGVAPAGRGDWILPDRLPPLTLAQASSRRLASLPAGLRRLLAGGARVGMRFHPSLVPPLDADTVWDAAAIEAGTRAGVLWAEPGGHLAFIHALDRASLMAELPDFLVDSCEAFIAAQLIRQQGSEATEAIAGHLVRAHQPVAAAVWQLMAGYQRWEQRDVVGARPWVETAAAALAHEPAEGRMAALEAAARLAVEDGDELAAQGWWQALAEAAAAAGAGTTEARACLGLAELALDREEVQGAAEAFERGRRLARHGHEPGLVAAAVAGLGRVVLARGAPDDAEVRLTDALERYAGLSDRGGAAGVLVALAAVRRLAGNLQEALQALDAARGWPADEATRRAESFERCLVLLDDHQVDAAHDELAELRKYPAPLRFQARAAALGARLAVHRGDLEAAAAQQAEAAWRNAPLGDGWVTRTLAALGASGAPG